MQYKISCIVIAYNTAPYIKECLDSIFSQNFNSFETIIIDNASSDNTRDIVEEYIQNKANVKFIKNPENLGGSYAANIGIKNATGEYVFIVDSDDIVPQGSLKALYLAAQKNNSDIVIGRTKSLIKNKLCNHKFSFYSVPFAYNGTYKTLKDCKELMISPFYWGRIYRTQFLLQNDILLPIDVIFADLYFNSLALKYAKNITVCEQLSYIWRRFQSQDEHVSITSGKNQRKFFGDRFKSYIDLEDLFSDKQNRELLYDIRIHNLVRLLVLSKYTAKSQKFSNEYCKKLYTFLKNIPFNDISDCPYLSIRRKIYCYLLKQKRFDDFLELIRSDETFETYKEENLEIIKEPEKFPRVPEAFMRQFVTKLNNCKVTNIKEQLFDYKFDISFETNPKNEYHVLRIVLIDENGYEKYLPKIIDTQNCKMSFKIPKKVLESIGDCRYKLVLEALVNDNFFESSLEYKKGELVITNKNSKPTFQTLQQENN